MPIVLVPFVAVGVALLALLIAYALTVLFTPILEGMAHEIPVVGGYIARGLKGALDYAGRKIAAWANEGVKLVAGWLHGLAQSVSGFVDAVNDYLVELPGYIDHLVTVTIPHLVDSLTSTAGNIAGDAKHKIDRLVADLSDVFTKPLADFKGIEHGVDLRIDALHRLIRNVDLPGTLNEAATDAQRGIDQVTGSVNDLSSYTFDEFGRVWDQLNKLPLQQVLDGLAAVAGAGALAKVIADEAGLGNASCRSKVKGICETDPLAWQSLLDVAGIALLWVGIAEFVQLAQEFARETLPTVLEHVHGG